MQRLIGSLLIAHLLFFGLAQATEVLHPIESPGGLIAAPSSAGTASPVPRLTACAPGDSCHSHFCLHYLAMTFVQEAELGCLYTFVSRSPDQKRELLLVLRLAGPLLRGPPAHI